MSIGTENLSELAVFCCNVGNAVDKSLSDKKISFTDSINFTAAVMSAPAAFMSISQVDKEYFDLDDAEKTELKTLVAEKLDLAADQVESIVEGIINMAIQWNSLVASMLKVKQAAVVTPEA